MPLETPYTSDEAVAAQHEMAVIDQIRAHALEGKQPYLDAYIRHTRIPWPTGWQEINQIKSEPLKDFDMSTLLDWYEPRLNSPEWGFNAWKHKFRVHSTELLATHLPCFDDSSVGKKGVEILQMGVERPVCGWTEEFFAQAINNPEFLHVQRQTITLFIFDGKGVKSVNIPDVEIAQKQCSQWEPTALVIDPRYPLLQGWICGEPKDVGEDEWGGFPLLRPLNLAKTNHFLVKQLKGKPLQLPEYLKPFEIYLTGETNESWSDQVGLNGAGCISVAPTVNDILA